MNHEPLHKQLPLNLLVSRPTHVSCLNPQILQMFVLGVVLLHLFSNFKDKSKYPILCAAQIPVNILFTSFFTSAYFIIFFSRLKCTHTHFLFVSPGVCWSRCMSSRELITALMRMITAHLSSSTSNREHLLLSVGVCFCVRFCNSLLC